MLFRSMIPYFSNEQISNKQILTFAFLFHFYLMLIAFILLLFYGKKILSDYSIKILFIKSSIKSYRKILSDLSTSVAYILHFRLLSVARYFPGPIFSFFLSFLFLYLSSFHSFFLSFFLFLYLCFFLSFSISFLLSIFLSSLLSFLLHFSFFDYSIPGSVAA